MEIARRFKKKVLYYLSQCVGNNEKNNDIDKSKKW